jgi:hypothetical protein
VRAGFRHRAGVQVFILAGNRLLPPGRIPERLPATVACSGFVQLRRAVNEHLQSGRMTADEWAAFALILTLVDFRSGIWTGSGVALSDYLKWCSRKSQLVLKSLERKKYIQLRPVRGKKGNYPVCVMNFHGKVANGDAPVGKSGASRCVTSAKVANGDATIEEVKQEEKIRTAPTPRGPHSVFRRDSRTAKEMEGFMEINTKNGYARKDYLEFIALRDAKKLPVGMTWEKWRQMPVDERKKVAA